MQGEESVWSDFKAGNRVAYEQVIRDYYQDLYAYGIRLINNPDFIKDCIHDLFIYIWERRANLGETDDIKVYLLKSLRNRVIKEISKGMKFTDLSEGVHSRMPSEWSKEDHMVSFENLLFTQKRIKNLLCELSPRQREVVHLRFFEGLSNDAIAGIMNISKPAVANLVHASLNTLRQIWNISRIAILLISSL